MDWFWHYTALPLGHTALDGVLGMLGVCVLPDEVVFAQDASCYSGHTVGAGLVVADPGTGWCRSYAIPILVHVDGSYQAELYVAWIVLRARGAHRVVWGVRGTQWSLHDSKTYLGKVITQTHAKTHTHTHTHTHKDTRTYARKRWQEAKGTRVHNRNKMPQQFWRSVGQ